MNINSNALTIIGPPANSTRKMDEITASPTRLPQPRTVVDGNKTEWPLPSKSSRTQGSTKHRKTNSGIEETPKQSKLSSFFARVNAAASPNPPTLTPLSCTIRRQTQGQEGMTTPTKSTNPPTPHSPPWTQLTTTPKPTASLPAGVNLLNPHSILNKTLEPTETSIQDISEEEEDEPPLSALKVREKRKPSTPKAGVTKSATKSVKPTKKASFSLDAPGVNMVIPNNPTPPKLTKIDHPFCTVLQTTVRVEKTKDVLKDFTGKLLDALAFLRVHVDPTTAFLPKCKEFTDDHIVDTASFPTVVFVLNQRYFQLESRGAFNSAEKSFNGRSIKLLLVLVHRSRRQRY